MPKLYAVGGAVRDYFLGLVPSKDVDFAVEADSYDAMRDWLVSELGVRVWKEHPEFVTVRGKLDLAPLGKFGGLMNIVQGQHGESIDVDFTLCRKEAQYHDRRHPSSVTPTTILEDLKRRDFTMNAIALDESGILSDPWNGLSALRLGTLTTCGAPRERFEEDPLRMVRALRFAVTRGLRVASETGAWMRDPGTVGLLDMIPEERIQYEMIQAFRANTPMALQVLGRFPLLATQIFSRNLWLKTTLEAR